MVPSSMPCNALKFLVSEKIIQAQLGPELTSLVQFCQSSIDSHFSTFFGGQKLTIPEAVIFRSFRAER